MALSYRLKTVADLVSKDKVVADIGCDHALLSIYLVENGISNKVYAIDNKKGPLAKANENIEEPLVNNYYAIPEDVWNMILADYTQQFKSGIKKPQLAHINIDVRLYNEEDEVVESEMEKLAHEFFGDNVNFV